ncbi:hypothetical protein [Nakamurella deserti]|uniref:hypothetical protein n=1 Tax=Nakamurella deserti TaxID=2164074 RepID=UPI000DBE81D8|nr:hypothetical protein [Nakamurella deserti]
MIAKSSTGAVVGFVIGAVLGYLFFNDADDVLLGTVVPTAILAISTAVVGYLMVRYTARQKQ